MPMGRSALMVVMREVMRRNRLKDGLIYLQVTRGAYRRDHAIPPFAKPSLIITARNIDPKGYDKRRAEGISVVTQKDIRWGRCDIKTTGLLPNVLAKTQARKGGAYEAWLVDAQGFVTEGASTNAWIVTPEGELITRQTDSGILAGITRSTLKSMCSALQLRFVERPFTLAEAKKAQEAFITSATSFVTPVVRIDGQAVGDGKPGATARRLREEYVRFAAQGEQVT